MKKDIDQLKEILRGQKKVLREEYGVSEIGLFGSYIRGEAKKDSDLDVLVKINRRMGLLKFISIENYLSDLLGVRVDLVMKDVLKPAIGKHILSEVVYV